MHCSYTPSGYLWAGRSEASGCRADVSPRTTASQGCLSARPLRQAGVKRVWGPMGWRQEAEWSLHACLSYGPCGVTPSENCPRSGTARCCSWQPVIPQLQPGRHGAALPGSAARTRLHRILTRQKAVTSGKSAAAIPCSSMAVQSWGEGRETRLAHSPGERGIHYKAPELQIPKIAPQTSSPQLWRGVNWHSPQGSQSCRLPPTHRPKYPPGQSCAGFPSILEMAPAPRRNPRV